jgi:ribosomal-protein-alanine acetyltransferase
VKSLALRQGLVFGYGWRGRLSRQETLKQEKAAPDEFRRRKLASNLTASAPSEAFVIVTLTPFVASMTRIRRVRQNELGSILRIEKSSFGRDAWNREQFLDYLAQPNRSVFVVATVDDKVVGYALAFHSRIRAEIDSLAVAPAQRGKGVASALMKRVIGVLRRRGHSDVSLSVRITNTAAIRLYQKLGFQKVRRLNGYYDDGASAWRMRRRMPGRTQRPD